MDRIPATHGLGVSETSGDHGLQEAVGNGDLLVGEGGPFGDPGTSSKVLGDEVTVGSGGGSYA